MQNAAPVYSESSSATESDSNMEDDEDDDDSGSEGMVIDEQDTSTPPPSFHTPSSPLSNKSALPCTPIQLKNTSSSLATTPNKSIPVTTGTTNKNITLTTTATNKSKTTKQSKNESMSTTPPTTTATSTTTNRAPAKNTIKSKNGKVKGSKESKTNTTKKQQQEKKSFTPKQKTNPKTSKTSQSGDTTATKSVKSVASTVPSKSTTDIMTSPSTSLKKKQSSNARSLMLTGRGVTTQMLIEQQILEPGEKCLSINYLGRKFVGDLLPDGTIKCHTAEQIFSSPSAWAMHCKKQVNPDKKSGCGWASVKYKGRKLDEFKSTWFRKQKIEQQVAASSENDSMASSPIHEYSYKMTPKSDRESPSASRTSAQQSPVSSPTKFLSGYIPPTENYVTFSEALKAVQNRTTYSSAGRRDSLKMPDFASQQKVRKRVTRTRISVKHSVLQTNSDPTTLVECAQFTSTGKIQPFSITISTSAMLLIDFHCHLTTSEVSGYLAGSWDVKRQHIRVTQAFPCRFNDSDPDAEIKENEIRSMIECKDLFVLGWYHSHPFCQPDPSIRDIIAQTEYQKALKDGHYEPCVGLIVSPYDSHKKESQFNAFWVRESSDSKSGGVGLPLVMKFTTHQDQILTQDLVNEMVALVNYYQSSTDCVKFSEIWSADSSYLDKLKHSVIRKFPQDQTDGRFLDFIHKMLMAVCS